MFTFLLVSLIAIYALFGFGVLSMARAASLSDETMDMHSVRSQAHRLQRAIDARR